MNFLENLFVCPACKNELKKAPDYYECAACLIKYPILESIPVFIRGSSTGDGSHLEGSSERREFWDKGWGKRVGRGDHAYLAGLTGEELRQLLGESIKSLTQDKDLLVCEARRETVEGKTVLDIGCGAGMQAPTFTYYGANYIGIDFSFNAAKYSGSYIKKLGGDGITAQADAEALPIRDESVDFVYSNGVLHHTPNTPVTFDEVNRVLKPGGTAAIGLYVTFSPKFIFQRLHGYYKILTSGDKAWFNRDESAWSTPGRVNLWTKTYTIWELKGLLNKYHYSSLGFRKFGFCWADFLLKLGVNIDKSNFGRPSREILAPYLGGMWAISFTKV